MKKSYVKPMVKKVDYCYDEQITAASNSYVGMIGSIHQHLNLCQYGVNEQGISRCDHYYYDVGVTCDTDQWPMSLRPMR